MVAVSTGKFCFVATALTVYGIETFSHGEYLLQYERLVATALTVYGIETDIIMSPFIKSTLTVATALTVYGIETNCFFILNSFPPLMLQQHLPFMVCGEECETIEAKSDNGCTSLYLD